MYAEQTIAYMARNPEGQEGQEGSSTADRATVSLEHVCRVLAHMCSVLQVRSTAAGVVLVLVLMPGVPPTQPACMLPSCCSTPPCAACPHVMPPQAVPGTQHRQQQYHQYSCCISQHMASYRTLHGPTSWQAWGTRSPGPAAPPHPCTPALLPSVLLPHHHHRATQWRRS